MLDRTVVLGALGQLLKPVGCSIPDLHRRPANEEHIVVHRDMVGDIHPVTQTEVIPPPPFAGAGNILIHPCLGATAILAAKVEKCLEKMGKLRGSSFKWNMMCQRKVGNTFLQKN